MKPEYCEKVVLASEQQRNNFASNGFNYTKVCFYQCGLTCEMVQESVNLCFVPLG